MTTTIIALGLLYFTGHLLSHIFDRTKIPDVLILIISGILIGPVLGFVDPQSIGAAGDLLTSVALIIILFDGGLGLEMGVLIRSAKQALLLTVAFFFISAAVTSAVMYAGFNYSPLASVLMGFICGGTASAVIIPMISYLNVGKEASSILIIESAVTTVLCIITVLGILDSYDEGNFEVGRIIGSLLSSLLLASVIGIIGGLLWLRLLNWIRTIANTQFATFAFMFIVYGVAEVLHFSGPIAALAFGFVLGNHKPIIRIMSSNVPWFNVESVGVISDAEKKLYKEIVFLIKIFFFVYLGISMPVDQMYTVGIAAALVFSLYTVRPLVTKVLARKRISPYDNSILSIMVPKGLAAAVLASLPTQYGMIEGADIQAITYNVIFISIILTSILAPIISNTPIGKAYYSFFKNKNNTAVAESAGTNHHVKKK
ncbi:MAG: cation:proton antiporter [Bacteroidales bacterium]|nr:cation:proton antiporter [Bacteroidales bacterium]